MTKSMRSCVKAIKLFSESYVYTVSDKCIFRDWITKVKVSLWSRGLGYISLASGASSFCLEHTLPPLPGTGRKALRQRWWCAQSLWLESSASPLLLGLSVSLKVTSSGLFPVTLLTIRFPRRLAESVLTVVSAVLPLAKHCKMVLRQKKKIFALGTAVSG